MCVVSRRFEVQPAGRAQQKLFLLKTHNRRESHPLGLGRVLGNVSWMEVRKERLDRLDAATAASGGQELGGGEWNGGGGRKSEAAGSCLSWF